MIRGDCRRPLGIKDYSDLSEALSRPEGPTSMVLAAARLVEGFCLDRIGARVDVVYATVAGLGLLDYALFRFGVLQRY